MKKFLTVPILAVLLLITGCPKGNWQKAAALADDFAHTVQTAQQMEINASEKGLIQKDDHVAVEQVFLELGKDGQTLDAAIRNGNSSKDITGAFDAALETVRKALDTADSHIKDATVKAEIDIALTGAKSILDTMGALKQ